VTVDGIDGLYIPYYKLKKYLKYLPRICVPVRPQKNKKCTFRSFLTN